MSGVGAVEFVVQVFLHCFKKLRMVAGLIAGHCSRGSLHIGCLLIRVTCGSLAQIMILGLMLKKPLLDCHRIIVHIGNLNASRFAPLLVKKALSKISAMVCAAFS